MPIGCPFRYLSRSQEDLCNLPVKEKMPRWCIDEKIFPDDCPLRKHNVEIRLTKPDS